MTDLTRAHRELLTREPDQCYSSLEGLTQACVEDRDRSQEEWLPPDEIWIDPEAKSRPTLITKTGNRRYMLNDWSFGQLCRLSGVPKKIVNRLTMPTASTLLRETVPHRRKPVQLLARNESLRSVHGTSYTRLFDAQLLEIVAEFAADFQPPPTAASGGTGLYRGEQDMFVFLIDPNGTVEIDDQRFMPGFFLWNSEVGRRAVGVETFWYQEVCSNHIVWNTTDVVLYERRHSTEVHEALGVIRELVSSLSRRRDQRRDRFARLIEAAMVTTLGHGSIEPHDQLTELGVPRKTAQLAIERVGERGALTVFNVLDEPTKMSQSLANAGERTAADSLSAQVLTLAM